MLCMHRRRPCMASEESGSGATTMKDPSGHIVRYDPGEPPYWEDDTGGQHLMMEDTMREILAELRALRLALGSQSRSSVELTENAKGAVQITVKAYTDSPIDSACVEAVAGFATLKHEVERGQMQQWKDTLADARADRASKDATYKRIYGEEPNSVYDIK